MTRPSSVLRELVDAARDKAPDEPVTWGSLSDAIRDALHNQEQHEWEESMGDDL